MPTQARAATETHSGHCICGAEHRSVGGHKIDATNNWKALTVDQNGHSITMTDSGDAIAVNGTGNNNTAKLTITDCKGTGKITHASGALGRGVSVGQ